MAFLTCRGLGKRYGDVVAVAGVDHDVERGELITLLGPSGCGKTTLLRLIAGLEVADVGSLAIDGRSLDGVPAAARNFGFVFQAYALFPTRTVADNIGFPLELRRVPVARRRARVQTLAELVQIEDLLARFPHELSGGQQQRVALARALAMEPELLLLDEPLSALDARIRMHLRTELRALVERLGITTVYVTHDQEEALELSDRVVVMQHGRIVQTASPVALYRRPVNRYVAEFIGRATLLPGRVLGAVAVELDSGHRLSVAPHALPGGARCVLCVRPEDVRLLASDVATFRATVQRRVFAGPAMRVVLDGPWGASLEAEVAFSDWQRLELSPGQQVGVEVSAADLHVLAETSGEDTCSPVEWPVPQAAVSWG